VEVSHLVVYDIASSRRREAVADVLVTCGARVQLSVFEIEVPDNHSILELRERLDGIIDADEDQIRIYPVGHGDVAMVLGNRVLEERRDFWIL
jgi:CRISPR-associated protein Cas2